MAKVHLVSQQIEVHVNNSVVSNLRRFMCSLSVPGHFHACPCIIVHIFAYITSVLACISRCCEWTKAQVLKPASAPRTWCWSSWKVGCVQLWTVIRNGFVLQNQILVCAKINFSRTLADKKKQSRWVTETFIRLDRVHWKLNNKNANSSGSWSKPLWQV